MSEQHIPFTYSSFKIILWHLAFSSKRWLIECNREICFETSAINGVHIISCAFIDTGIHLCSRIDLDFRLYSVVSYSPFVHLIDPNENNCSIHCKQIFPSRVRQLDHLRACTNVGIFQHRPSAMWCAAVGYLLPHTKMQFYDPKRIHNRNEMLAGFSRPGKQKSIPIPIKFFLTVDLIQCSMLTLLLL